jgi:hypothetical protein
VASKIKRLIQADLKAKHLIFAHNYTIQMIDDEVMDAQENDFGVVNFRIRVQGLPSDPNKIIPVIIPDVQSYIEHNYPQYEIDNVTFDNFNIQTAEKSRRFPNTIDFNFSAKFSPKKGAG